MEYKSQKTSHKKDQKIRRKKNDVKNPLISENEIYEGNTEHVARRLLKRKNKKGKWHVL